MTRTQLWLSHDHIIGKSNRGSEMGETGTHFRSVRSFRCVAVTGQSSSKTRTRYDTHLYKGNPVTRSKGSEAN